MTKHRQLLIEGLFTVADHHDMEHGGWLAGRQTGRQAGRHGAVAVAKGLHLMHKHMAEGKQDWPGMTCLFQQGHSS